MLLYALLRLCVFLCVFMLFLYLVNFSVSYKKTMKLRPFLYEFLLFEGNKKYFWSNKTPFFPLTYPIQLL